MIDTLYNTIGTLRYHAHQDKNHLENSLRLLKETSVSPAARRQVTGTLTSLLLNHKFVALFAASDIPPDRGLFGILKAAAAYKLVPPVQEPDEFSGVLGRYFSRKDDYVWVNSIPDREWIDFFRSLDWEDNPGLRRHLRKEMLNSVQVLAQKVASLGIDKEVVSKIPRWDDLDSPFLGLNREVMLYIEKSLKSYEYLPDDRESDYRHILVMLRQCENQTDFLHKHKNDFGISLRMTYIIRQLEQYLGRLDQLLHLLESRDTSEKWHIIVRLFKEMVFLENTRYSIRRHLSSNMHMLTYKIVENTSKTGQYYIAADRKAYWNLFGKALGGGAIVAVLCCNKTRIYFNHFPIFWEAFFYSLNYAIGFMLIHVLHFTLATKQPALTASTIASTLSNNGQNPNWLSDTTRLLTRLIRSQFISLAGNALIAFPVAYLLARLYHLVSGQPVADFTKSHHLISELNPWQSLAIPHAAIAGVYLMVSGLISGYYENNWIYYNLTERIRQHPVLRKVLSPGTLDRLAGYLERNIGGLAGNTSLGIFLGSTAAVGLTLGLPLDIRHITFASGNFGIAVAGLNNHVSPGLWIDSILGIAAIGITNVFVSFGLSILFALNSRNTALSEAGSLFRNLAWHFFHKPLSFFFPIEKNEKPEAGRL